MTMVNFAPGTTPEEIQKQEDWINRTLPRAYGATVCLHADRTTTTWRSDADGETWTGTECDYCPAFVVSPPGITAHLAPSYFTDGPAVL